MYRVQILITVIGKSNNAKMSKWIDYSSITWGCELDALDEYTKARLEGHTARIMEV